MLCNQVHAGWTRMFPAFTSAYRRIWMSLIKAYLHQDTGFASLWIRYASRSGKASTYISVVAKTASRVRHFHVQFRFLMLIRLPSHWGISGAIELTRVLAFANVVAIILVKWISLAFEVAHASCPLLQKSSSYEKLRCDTDLEGM